MVLSIILVSWNTREDLLGCLASIRRNPPSSQYEVLVFDNASSDGSAQAVAAYYPEVELEVSSRNVGFGPANNRAAERAKGRFWLLLNPDTVVQPGALDGLVDFLSLSPDAAAVGPRLVNVDGSHQPSIERLPTLFREWWRLFHLDQLYPLSQYARPVHAARSPQRVEVLRGACLLLRADAVKPLGLFDEEYFVYSEEVDLCDRLREMHWGLYWLPEAVIIHRGGRSTAQVADQMFLELYRNKIKFFRKRRGSWTSRIYKLILLQAALVRYIAGQAARILPIRRRQAWAETARQYRLLVAALPTL